MENTQRRVRLDKYGRKERERERKRGLSEEKEESERGTSLHMKECFFCRLAVAATQYFNTLLDPRQARAGRVCVSSV